MYLHGTQMPSKIESKIKISISSFDISGDFLSKINPLIGSNMFFATFADADPPGCRYMGLQMTVKPTLKYGGLKGSNMLEI